ncbi:hypothetical protein HELRODRAFT_158626 [Helobdella robusta]|uniref:Endonuclease/exonuclease/phosphatase domain-containing protein n=1 Tax=Helobdella robusta TaxID=6412 RepID=T1EN12_HELRO|nr:hypothetical protein HELRODRAFT_158626 [Helobdella robusta]ESO12162.1 hypothetical protein HELRODRAFT_158626 [Helobdella robusta]
MIQLSQKSLSFMSNPVLHDLHSQRTLHLVTLLVKLYKKLAWERGRICSSGFTASISTFLDIPNVVVLGDMNAHDTLWYSGLEDLRGEALAWEIENSECGTLNTDNPTHLRRNPVEVVNWLRPRLEHPPDI